MFHILWLIGTPSTNKCCNFQNTGIQINNNCLLTDDHAETLSQVPKKNCENSFTGIQRFLENFLKKHRHITEKLYTSDMNRVLCTTLFKHIKRYNLTEVDLAYLNSILNMNSQPYNKLNIEFRQFIQESKVITIERIFSLRIIYDVYYQTINYCIHFGKIIPKRSIKSQVSQRTKLIISTITNSKTHSFITSETSQTTVTTKLKGIPSKTSINNIVPMTRIKESKQTTSIIKAKENFSILITETTSMLTVNLSLTTRESLTIAIPMITTTTTTVTSIAATILLVLTMMTFVATATDTIPTVTITGTISTTTKTVKNITMITMQTNINLTTSLSSQSSSSLLCLLSAFIIIILCVIIAFIWGVARKNNSNNQYDTDNQCLNAMSNTINTEKYHVTDKDSKSGASWSHGSALLLSSLVK